MGCRNAYRSPWSASPSIWFLFTDKQFTLHASFPHSVALMQLRFTSLTVTSLREDLHLQECAPAGRTKKKPRSVSTAGLPGEFKLSCWHQASAGIRSCEPGPGHSWSAQPSARDRSGWSCHASKRRTNKCACSAGTRPSTTMPWR